MEFVCFAFFIYYFILLARVIFSWVHAFGGRIPDGVMPLYEIVFKLTEPLMAFFRRFIPPIGGFDISVLFIFIGLSIVQGALCS